MCDFLNIDLGMSFDNAMLIRFAIYDPICTHV